MSCKEWKRREWLSRVAAGGVTVKAASEGMGLSLRQSRRLWKRFKQEGPDGVVHRGLGRPSGRRMPDDLRAEIVKRYMERYDDHGPLLACEKLAGDGFQLSPNTLTALLKERHLWVPRRRGKLHRMRRDRRACFGTMVQMDGSHHAWFEGRAGKCVLMVLVDDATNWTYARLYEAETTQAAFDAFGRWVEAHGVPQQLYVDRHSIYREDEHPERPTQFGRAMEELGVELICAHSPQAKGRVENRHRLFQDRLVKELRLRGISDVEQANDLLDGVFLAEINHRYALEPREETDAHRMLVPGQVLGEVLCVQEERTVGNDGCVRWQNRWLQLLPLHGSLVRKRVLVKQLGSGVLMVEYRGQRLECRELAARSVPRKVKALILNNRRWTPPAEHPWRQEGEGEKALPRVIPASAAPARGLHAGGQQTG